MDAENIDIENLDAENRDTGSIETSIVVRTFNEARHLPALFDALDAQRYRNFEVIVVDSGSFDRTREIAAERADRLLRISSEDFTFGYSLNQGIAEARGDYVAILSAHTLPRGPDWLGNLIQPLKDDPDTAMAYGRQTGVPSSRFSEAEDFERIFGPAPREDTLDKMAVNNANAAIRRDFWLQRPFDEILLGLEDMEWASHWIGQQHKVVYEPRAEIAHIHEETWAQIRRRYYREALAARLMGFTGRRHLPALLLRETGHILVDLVRAVGSHDNPVTERLSAGQRMREVIYFRFHKNVGAFRGLLETHPIPSRSDRHALLFDRPTKAVVVHGPKDVRLDDVPMPELKPSEVLIKVSHVAVCATDLEVAQGTLGYFKTGLSAFPIVPGHEFSGRIVTVGLNVRDFNEGDAVVVEAIQSCGTCDQCRAGNTIACEERAEVGVMRRNGAYADYVTMPARFVHRLPAGLDLRRAALTEPLAVVLKALRRLENILTPQTVRRCAVIGAGPLGHLCAKVLAQRGHKVTAFDRNPKRLALFKGTGIEVAERLDGLADHDLVIEITGDPDVLAKALHETPANATLLLLGLPYGQQNFSFESIAAYDKTVIGSVGSAKEDFEAAIRLLPTLDLKPYFECSMRLAEFSDAWKRSQSGDVLKVILEPQ